jgi:ketosteroid isomerase-like protein
MHRLAVPAITLAFAAAGAQAQSSSNTERGQRELVRGADAAAALVSWKRGLPAAIEANMSDDIVLLLDGAPVTRGGSSVRRLLREVQGLAPKRVTWQPFRVLVSRDISTAVTFGESVIQSSDSQPAAFSRYASVWRRQSAGEWRIVAHVHNGLVAAVELSAAADGSLNIPLESRPRDDFARADLAFAKMAGDSGAPVSFARFAAPNAITFAGSGELNVGPAAIRARLAESVVSTAAWKWWPVISIAAPSGDLGVTIGEAEILIRGQSAPLYSKYLTVWQRQADGSLKYVTDLGNSRPQSVTTGSR